MLYIYILRLRCRLGLVLPAYTWALGDSSLVPEGCVGSSGHRLVGREPGRSPQAGADLWSLVELQSLKVYYDALGGVVYPWSGDLIRSAIKSRASLFYECDLSLLGWLSVRRHLHQGHGPGGGICCPDSTPSTVKSVTLIVLCYMFCIEEGPCTHEHLLYYLGRQKPYTIG
ncbi:hypothetical protein B296_00008923 [Ensete ventricosum]|uniref:Uncharacterized protein n=1 Tax=Ensete ventricosum TaxID=4639 RepID=A0A427A422_ENSVE|nr:hypothetical protein B296_00008923 [Ensete ventricosum]